MTLTPPTDVVPADLPAVRAVIAAAIRTSVARSEEEALFLVSDVEESLTAWQAHPEHCVHLKCRVDGQLAGVILVKDHWNLTNLFVAPPYQGSGIGRLLLTQAIARCRPVSPRPALLVHSSTVAVGFYRRMGFVPNGEPRDRPGGCVPLRYDWHAAVTPGDRGR
ncbi:MAG: GNAT family N-acetyltransferase [Chromatiales bacterium]|jgi:GNAT superfamily N-acetyltransferase|nr:GNAT family N-acetyltransferase [Chromatiales bacterium]